MSMYQLSVYDPIFLIGKRGSNEGRNKCQQGYSIQVAWRDCGGRVTFPSKFNCTKNRRLITTARRNKDPNTAALIAAQHCHRVTIADSIYVFEQSKQMVTNVVHLAIEALNKEASRDDVHHQITEAFHCNLNCMDQAVSPYWPMSLSAMY